MSANISLSSTGQAEVFAAGEPAWHNLGANVKEAPTWEKAAKLAGLTWEVTKKQLLNPVTKQPIPSFALLRGDDNRWLNTVGPDYIAIQNPQIFSFTNAVIGAGAKYESAGALGRGEIVWCLARLPGSFEPVKGDKHIPYLLFVDYRGGKAAQTKLVLTRVVCWNTLNAALHEGGTSLKLRHDGSIHEKMKLAEQLLKQANGQFISITDRLKKLAEKKVTQNQFELVMTKLFPGWDKQGHKQNQAAVVANNFMSNDGGKIANIQGTAYSLFQSVTRYIDHQKDGFKVNASPEVDKVQVMAQKRAESALFGTGEDFKQDAFDAVCQAVDVEPVFSNPLDNILSKVSLSVPAAN
jgi:phage/plasmid-like protein (TIGR03299 family)